METRRLKNVALLILLLLNLFLLLLLGYQEFQGRRVSHDAVEKLKELFAEEKMTLSLSANDIQESLTPLILARHSESERMIATFLLGEPVVSESQGGGIVSYSAEGGIVQFRAGGNFDTVSFCREIKEVISFSQQFCEKFDYEDMEVSYEGESIYVTATQNVANVPILGCTVSLRFEKGCLISVVGSHIELGDAVTDSKEYMNGISALVHFLDYRQKSGVVCSEVRGVRCIYQLQNTTTLPTLFPVWEIRTDSYTYLVDGISAVVSRK